MKRVRVEAWCDACDAEGEGLVESVETVPITISSERASTLDLCSPHLALFVEPLAKLVASHGVPPEEPSTSAKPRRPQGLGGAWKCPRCDYSSTTRAGTVGHISGRHDVDRVVASQMVPPLTNAVACTSCGMVTAGVQGISTHYGAMHPELKGKDEWGKAEPWEPVTAAPARKRASRAKAKA